ncbi:hypothetical protein V8D89_003143 [Ganoderma adspersum]
MTTNIAGASLKAPPTRKALPPFDKGDADFIIRSCDNVDFYVFRAVLTLASTVFEEMFRIPQPPAEGSGGHDHNLKPAVGVSEDSQVVDTFLRVIYPLTTPQTTSLSHVRKVLEAGMKYDVSVVVNEMRMALTKPCFLADDPLQVFSIAYNCRFEEETRAAAAHAVAQGHLDNVDAHLPELAGVTAGAYYRLMQFHRNHKHAQAGSKSTNDNQPPMPTPNDVGPFCREAPLPLQPGGDTIPSVLAPFTDPGADLAIKSRDGRTFRVHRTIIDAASPTLLSALLAEDIPDRAGDTPTYRMPENSAVVDALLRFCYPAGSRPRFSGTPESAAHFLHVLAVLQRHAPAAADDLVHADWARYASREPFRFFFHAVARGLALEARTCAKLVAGSVCGATLDTLYVPEMEGVGALAYHRLLAYVQAHRTAALQSVNGCTWVPQPPAAKPTSTSTSSHSPDSATRPACVDGVKCVCADSALAQAKSKTPLLTLLPLLVAKLSREPRGGALLNDHALVDELAGAAHNAMCLPRLYGSVSPSISRLLVVPAMVCQWSFPAACAVALVLRHFQAECGCPKAKHIPWAEARLRGIARRVDEAVSQVKLDLSGVLK